MQRRGLRWEVDEPTEWQLRNKRWLAEHPLITSLVGAVLFVGVGLLFADAKDFSLGTGALVGAVAGAALGWGFSAENREHVDGRTRAVYFAATAVGIVFVVAMKAL
jgi:hypothetical protein